MRALHAQHVRGQENKGWRSMPLAGSSPPVALLGI